jgi:site-specific DNA recombinase
MVWNRRATKTASGKHNPSSEWVWSSRPTHEPLVSKEVFLAAQKVLQPGTLTHRHRA